jgi:hypothetical protein
MAIALLFSLTIILEYLNKATIIKNSFCQKKLKLDRRTMLWLCAAAEVPLTEQKKTGDSVLLFVASSTASQFNCT